MTASPAAVFIDVTIVGSPTIKEAAEIERVLSACAGLGATVEYPFLVIIAGDTLVAVTIFIATIWRDRDEYQFTGMFQGVVVSGCFNPITSCGYVSND